MPRVAALLFLSLLVAAPAAAQREHVVRTGQTLASVARRYHVDVWDLALASGIQPGGARVDPGDGCTTPGQLDRQPPAPAADVEDRRGTVERGQDLGEARRASVGHCTFTPPM